MARVVITIEMKIQMKIKNNVLNLKEYMKNRMMAFEVFT